MSENIKERLHALMLEYVKRNGKPKAIEVIRFDDRSESWSYSSYTGGVDYYVDIIYRTIDVMNNEVTEIMNVSGPFYDFLNALLEIEESLGGS